MEYQNWQDWQSSRVVGKGEEKEVPKETSRCLIYLLPTSKYCRQTFNILSLLCILVSDAAQSTSGLAVLAVIQKI